MIRQGNPIKLIGYKHNMTKIREFKVGDEDGLWRVFYSSIHQVCTNNYNEEQLQAWAPANLDQTIWVTKMRSIKPYIALNGDKIIGYADLQEDGKIDHFFVHGDHQGQGVGRCLMNKVIDVGASKKRLYSEVSHTAKLFYEKNGFSGIKEQTVTMRGVELGNNLMERRHTG